MLFGKELKAKMAKRAELMEGEESIVGEDGGEEEEVFVCKVSGTGNG